MMIVRNAAIALLLAAGPLPALAAPLTVKTGETWAFSLGGGQPVKARKVAAGARPAPGQIVVTVRSMMGTTMTITSNNKQAYTYQAQLVGTAKPVAIRSCTLPANSRVSFENWPQAATAVRLSDFKVAPKGGACP